MIMLVGLGLVLLGGVSKYLASLPYSPPHIRSAPYVWGGSCRKDQYDKGVLSCDCVNDQYKVSSWNMTKYGINPQRSEGLYRVGNDLVEVTKDFSSQCSAKNIYRNVFFEA